MPLALAGVQTQLRWVVKEGKHSPTMHYSREGSCIYSPIPSFTFLPCKFPTVTDAALSRECARGSLQMKRAGWSYHCRHNTIRDLSIPPVGAELVTESKNSPRRIASTGVQLSLLVDQILSKFLHALESAHPRCNVQLCSGTQRQALFQKDVPSKKGFL